MFFSSQCLRGLNAMTFLTMQIVKFLNARGYISITNSDAMDLLPGSVFFIFLGGATWFSDFTITFTDGSSFTPPLLGPGLPKILLGVPIVFFGVAGLVVFWKTKDTKGLSSKNSFSGWEHPQKHR